MKRVIVRTVLLTLFFVIFSLICFSANSVPASEDVPEQLSITSRPDSDKGPTRVSTAVWLMDIDSIDSSAQSFVANVFVALKWKDPRLADGRGGIRTFDITHIWNPRIQIANEIGLVRRTFPEVVDVEPDGSVVYRQRFVGPFSQPMDLNDFPFDTQTFQLQLVSPSNAPDEIEFVRDQSWVEAGLPKAGGIAKNISLPDWKIESFDTGSTPYIVAPGVSVAGFSFDFVAKRDTRHYIWKVILPLFFIVMMSWSVFWIDPSKAGTQIAVATTSMLTLIAYRFAIDSQVPRVPYMTKLDQFIVFGTIIVFLSLAQVITTSRLDQVGKTEIARKMDKVSRIVFPVVFIFGLIMALAG